MGIPGIVRITTTTEEEIWLNYSEYKKVMVTLWHDRGVSEPYGGFVLPLCIVFLMKWTLGMPIIYWL